MLKSQILTVVLLNVDNTISDWQGKEEHETVAPLSTETPENNGSMYTVRKQRECLSTAWLCHH